MSVDTKELRRLAVALLEITEAWHRDEQNNELGDAWSIADGRFIEKAGPAAILSLLDELDRLSSEVDRLHSKTSTTIGVGNGSGNLFVHGDYDSIKRVQSLVLESSALRKDAERWKCVRNAIQMQSPYAVWDEGRRPLFGKAADELIDSFLQVKEGGANV